MGRGAGTRVEGHLTKEFSIFSAAIVGSTAQSAGGTIYDLGEYNQCVLVVSVASYSGSGNIVISLQDCPTNATTYAAKHGTASGNLSANGITRIAIGDWPGRYARIHYVIASTAKATVIVTGTFKS